MSPAEAGAATLAVIILAVLAAYRILCWLLDRHIRTRRQERAELTLWQARARQAATNVDAARAQRDLNTCRDIWPDAPTRIPRQTRRTEDNQ